MTPESSKPAASWRFRHAATAFKAAAGDVLRYYPDRPMGYRVTIERTVQAHEGVLDRLILGSAIEPIGADIGTSRKVLVDQVSRDAQARNAA